MAASVRTEVVGVRDAVRALNKIEPGLRKQFTSEANRIAQPAIQEVQASYPDLPLSGMARTWNSSGRRLFPYDVGRARRGVKLKVDAGRNAVAVIRIQQNDPGAAVFESAGRANANPLGASLGSLAPGRTRVLGPAVYRKRREVESEMSQLVLDTVRRVNAELR